MNNWSPLNLSKYFESDVADYAKEIHRQYRFVECKPIDLGRFRAAWYNAILALNLPAYGATAYRATTSSQLRS